VKSLVDVISRKLTARKIRRIEVALSALPQTPEGVAHFLDELGIVGVSYPESCPVALYLKLRTGIPVDVYSFGILVRGIHQCVNFSDAIHDFIMDFDNHKDYIPDSLRVKYPHEEAA
jgi:hypothetical protein